MTQVEPISTQAVAVARRGVARSRGLTLGLIALALFGIALLFRLPFCTAEIFTYDAADYSRAIRAGVLPQYLASDSATLPEFIKRRRSDPKFETHAWGYLYQENDGAALRHFHVPLGFYLPALLHDGGVNERGQRVGVAVVSAVTVSVAFLIVAASAVPLWLAVLTGLFAASSPVLILAGTNISPHPWFTLFSIVALYSFCRWLDTSGARWMTLFAVTLAASIASLELAPILVITVLGTGACVGLTRFRDRVPLFPLRQCGLCAAWLAGSLAVLWPGGWLRGGYVMSYGVFVFQGLFRSAVYFHRRDLFSTIARLGNHPVAGWALAALLLAAVWRAWRGRRNSILVAFTIYASLLLAQGFGNGFTNPTYASHAVLTIAIASALSFPRNLPAGAVMRWGPVFVLAILTGAGLLRLLGPDAEEVRGESRRVTGVINQLKQAYPRQSAFVVTQDVAPFLAYAPEFRFYPAKLATSSLPKPWISPGPYRLLVDTDGGAILPRVPLCPGPLGAYHFAVSCEPLTARSGEDPR